MKTKISLNPQEQNLRSLLLEVADFVGSCDGYEKPVLRFAGGWVRDKLLGTTTKDVDVGISCLTGESFSNFMKQYLLSSTTPSNHTADILGTLSTIKGNPEKSKHLETVTTKIYGIDVDLVNLRKETYSEESRNPVMDFGTAEEDASRRDITINALFYNLSSDLVEDPTGNGLRDMELKVIRTPMDPFQTFKDDPLRVLRCIRFSSRLGYTINEEVLRAMNDSEIVRALRLKISRERVGDEVLKMLKGSSPQTALSLINSLGLFDVIFTDPTEISAEATDTRYWHLAYELLSEILVADEAPFEPLRSILMANQAEVYLAWLLSAVVPLGRYAFPPSDRRRKSPLRDGAFTAQEGLKLDNKSGLIISDALSWFDDVITMKNSFLLDQAPASLPLKRVSDDESNPREKFGMAIRRWASRKNSNWRMSVLFALLFEQTQGESRAKGPELVQDYATWLLHLKDLDLLEVNNLKLVANGKDLMRAVGKGSGPWISEALETVTRWQLRNPGCSDPDEAMAEAVRKFKG